jgi:hypothetical protein
MSDSSPRPLKSLQEWMLQVITTPAGIAAGADFAGARQSLDAGSERIEEVILPSEQLDSVSRLRVYGNAYFTRLIECLGDEYPAVKAALSAETFDSFALQYLQHYPSRSYTLGALGRRFPQFLAETRPANEPPGSWPDFLIDLARLEAIYSEIFDGPGYEEGRTLPPEQLQQISPEEWPGCRMIPVPCLRMETFGFPVHEYATAVRKRNEAPLPPAPAETHLVLTRRDYVVRRTAVTFAEYDLLQRIADGATVGDAIASAAESQPEELESHLHRWFHRWAAAGYFAGLEFPGDRRSESS